MKKQERYDRFFELEEINAKFGELLTDRYDSIRKEFDENKHHLKYANWDPSTGYDGTWNSIEYNGWKAAPLIMNVDEASFDFCRFEDFWKQKLKRDKRTGNVIFEDNTKLFPTLFNTLLECGVTTRVGICTFMPDSYIHWHVDPDPDTDSHVIIRGVWGIDVQQEEGKESCLLLGDKSDHDSWKLENNKSILIWGRTNHRLDNSLTTPRHVLIFDHTVSREFLKSIL